MGRTGTRVALFAVLVAAVLAVSTQGTAFGVRTVGLSTGTFDLSLAGGQTGGGEVVVSNNGDEDIDVLIYAADQIVSDTGSIGYQAPSVTGMAGLGTPASWMRMVIGAETKTRGNTPYVSLAPGEQVPVEFELEIPEGAPPGDHQVIVFFEMFGGDSETEGATTDVTGRVGARVSVRVAGEVFEKLEVRPFVTRTFVLSRLVPYTYVVRNEGNIDKRIDARILLLDGDLEEVASSLATSDTPVFAGTNFEQAGSVDPGKQLLGRYTMRLEVTYPREGSEVGASDAITIDKTVWILPLWLVIVLIVLAGGVAVWLSWRSATRADERKRERSRLSEDARGSGEDVDAVKSRVRVREPQARRSREVRRRSPRNRER
ncbi:MAG: COG1361 family protein [Coriobacteriia bacterium]